LLPLFKDHFIYEFLEWDVYICLKMLTSYRTFDCLFRTIYAFVALSLDFIIAAHQDETTILFVANWEFKTDN
jgi:hypothetical protein